MGEEPYFIDLIEKELYQSRITQKMEQWIDEQEGWDNLGDNTQEDDFKLEVPKK